MLHFLGQLGDDVSVLNVFRYITFRTGGATMTALLFVFLFGPAIIEALRVRQGKGQPIRADGPQSHLLTKAGTPTMGGLMILSGLLVSTLLWANLANVYVWVVLLVTIGFGADRPLRRLPEGDQGRPTRGFSGRARLAPRSSLIAAASPASSIVMVGHGAAVDVARASLLQGRSSSTSASSSFCSAPS